MYPDITVVVVIGYFLEYMRNIRALVAHQSTAEGIFQVIAFCLLRLTCQVDDQIQLHTARIGNTMLEVITEGRHFVWI